jgi:lipoate-protein ligase A
MPTRTDTRAWRLLCSGHADAFLNMAVDEAILLAVAEGAAAPTLRLYGWRPPGVSLGYFQPLAREIDAEACRRHGYDIVRRPTGGRAILHDDEVTYSVCVRQADVPGGDRILASYRWISRGIEAAFASLGLGTTFGGNGSRDGGKALPAACFAKAARADMVVDGRKIVGSAQTRRRGAILQHGSIPLSLDFETIADVMPGRPEARTPAAAALAGAATSVSAALGRPVTFDELCESLVRGFEAALSVRLVERDLSADERETAQRLRRDKYATDAWNLSPGRKHP